MEEQFVETLSSVDFQPLTDFLTPYLSYFVICFGVVIALLVVILFAKGWQSNAK